MTLVHQVRYCGRVSREAMVWRSVRPCGTFPVSGAVPVAERSAFLDVQGVAGGVVHDIHMSVERSGIRCALGVNAREVARIPQVIRCRWRLFKCEDVCNENSIAVPRRTAGGGPGS